MAFEKFTVKARKVVVAAQEEARQRNHNYIGTEHLLLALLDEPDSTASRVLHQLGYTKELAQVDIDAMVGTGREQRSGHIPFTPRAKKVLEFALREAMQLQHNYIGTEHILLALVREGEGVGAQALANRIKPISRIGIAVVAALDASGQADPASPAGSWPAGTPATEDTVTAASALAGGAPVGSHHLLEAMVQADNSMAARVLRELGVDPEAVAAKIDELDPETTTDANPAESAARKMEIRVVDDEVHVVLRDAATVTIAKKVTELVNGPIEGVGPVAGMFVPLWRSTNQLMVQIQRVLEPESEFDEDDGSATSKAARLVRAVLAPRLRNRRRG